MLFMPGTWDILHKYFPGGLEGGIWIIILRITLMGHKCKLGEERGGGERGNLTPIRERNYSQLIPAEIQG